jgi:rhodanese-related sulfurtransferase
LATRFETLVNAVRAVGIEEITVSQLGALTEARVPIVLLDIREASERGRGGTVQDASHLPRGLLEVNIERHAGNPHQLIVLVCSDGRRSVLAAESLRRMGYDNVKVLEGGFRALRLAQQ